MQYLVYENHSKFIKASETIREVSELCFVVCVFALLSVCSSHHHFFLSL